MAISIHVPKALVARVDARAAELKISRSRFIAQVLEQELRRETDWSDAFLCAAKEAQGDGEAKRAVDEMEEAIASSRSGKAPPRLAEP